MKNEVRLVSIPSRLDVIKVIVVPMKLTLINQTAAPDAKVIRLIQSLDEPVGLRLERPVL